MSEQQNLPAVTVLIANHNYDQYLAGAIQSAKNQDYKQSVNICVIDDGSTDDSWKIIHQELFKGVPHEKKVENGVVHKYTADHKYVAIQLPLATGPSNARNVGIEATAGTTDVYAILDADDEMYPNKVSTCIQVFMQNSEEVAVIYGDYDILNVDTGRSVREYKEPYSKERLMQECIVHSGALVSKKALYAVREETGFYDREMRTCEDYDLWIRISEQFMIYHVPESLTLVRVTPENSSNTVRKEIWEQNWRRIGLKTQAR